MEYVLSTDVGELSLIEANAEDARVAAARLLAEHGCREGDLYAAAPSGGLGEFVGTVWLRGPGSEAEG